ncbi:MAG: CHASE domain-containing protein [Chloroflexi bacterium]|nr:CHASE domain-containing protein [Chloroflexota bacterium]
MTRFRNVPHLVQYLIVGAIGVVISLLLLTSVRNQSRLQAYNRLDRRAEQLAVAVQEGINAKLQVLQAFQAFYAVDGVVDRDEFKKFAVVTLTYHPDIQALQWIPYTPAADREALEARGKLEYGADFGITERNSDGETIPALERDVYFPIFYTEPLEGNKAVLGLDAAFEPTRRTVVELAWYSGIASASAPIRLVQETGDQRAVLLYQPIYSDTPPPTTPEQRATALLGFVPVVLRTGDFMTSTLSSYDTSDFAITLVDIGSESEVLYRSSELPASEHSAFATTKSIKLANRQWEIHFVSSDAQLNAEMQFDGVSALLIVLGLTAGLVAYLAQRNRAERMLRGYATSLEESNRELDAYNHTIAHDLKSPLAIISGYAYLLTDEKLTPDGQRMLNMIPKVVDNMVEMIDGLLQLAKLRDAIAAVQLVDMNAALTRAMERFDDAQEQITVEGELPPAMGHAPWMTEVFANLINNALKYTAEGRLANIRIRGVRQDKKVRYEVSDNGIGIKPEDQQRIFEMFTRLSDPDMNTKKGLGIGLSIVQRIMQRSGGEVGVSSEHGKGSTFWFTLNSPPESPKP